MSLLRVENFSVSLDGYGAGPNQRLDEPLGDGGEQLHTWMFATATMNDGAGTTGADNDAVIHMNDNIGATIMGRNMFGPVRGAWPDESWQGWWGPEPPYHNDVFVMTHYARPDLPMAGGTTFHFTDAAPEAVLEQARHAAAGKDVLVAGGASVVQQFWARRLIDRLHLVVSPVLLGAGERLWQNLDGALVDYQCTSVVTETQATHVTLERR